MKLVKMSLVAAMVMGASAFALDNVKVSGDAKVFYGTDDHGNVDLFDQANSYADAALRVGATGDLLKGVSFGVTANAVSTLGLENNLVANTWTSAHKAAVEDNAWISEAWLAATMGKTTAKIGRMELDTPLAFSEKWSVVANTFDAAVLINQDIPNTTLVGAWVGKGNGVNTLGANGGLTGVADNSSAVGMDAYMAAEGSYSTLLKNGAYAAAAVNNSWKPLTVQAWYYNAVSLADAYWLQADMNCVLVPGIQWGAQYSMMDTKDLLAGAADTEAYALKAGYVGIQNLKLQVAYSDVSEKGTLKISNVATNNLGAAQSKLYTESWWTYGNVGKAGSEAWNATAEFDAGVAKVGAYYTAVNMTNDVNELAVTASKSFGPLDATVAYVNTDTENADAVNTVQAYLTLNF